MCKSYRVSKRIKIIEMSNGFLCFFIDTLHLDSFALGCWPSNAIKCQYLLKGTSQDFGNTNYNVRPLTILYNFVQPSYLQEINHDSVAHSVLFLESEAVRVLYTIDGPRC